MGCDETCDGFWLNVEMEEITKKKEKKVEIKTYDYVFLRVFLFGVYSEIYRLNP